MAPDHMAETFETYIARSLQEEIDRIPGYYRDRGGIFLVAELSADVIGMFGLETSSPSLTKRPGPNSHDQPLRRSDNFNSERDLAMGGRSRERMTLGRHSADSSPLACSTSKLLLVSS
jgi:hypothetical protein